MGDDVKKAIDDAKDALHEAKHRSEAGIDHAAREIAGDEMTTEEKVKSFVHEDLENTKADIDKTKRVIRDKT